MRPRVIQLRTRESVVVCLEDHAAGVLEAGAVVVIEEAPADGKEAAMIPVER